MNVFSPQSWGARGAKIDFCKRSIDSVRSRVNKRDMGDVRYLVLRAGRENAIAVWVRLRGESAISFGLSDRRS